jgi:hypothetical protein
MSHSANGGCHGHPRLLANPQTLSVAELFINAEEDPPSWRFSSGYSANANAVPGPIDSVTCSQPTPPRPPPGRRGDQP